MVKLSKCRQLLNEYKNSILYGAIAMLGILGIVATLHHTITLLTVISLIGICFYILWSNK